MARSVNKLNAVRRLFFIFLFGLPHIMALFAFFQCEYNQKNDTTRERSLPGLMILNNGIEIGNAPRLTAT